MICFLQSEISLLRDSISLFNSNLIAVSATASLHFRIKGLTFFRDARTSPSSFLSSTGRFWQNLCALWRRQRSPRDGLTSREGQLRSSWMGFACPCDWQSARSTPWSSNQTLLYQGDRTLSRRSSALTQDSNLDLDARHLNQLFASSCPRRRKVWTLLRLLSWFECGLDCESSARFPLFYSCSLCCWCKHLSFSSCFRPLPQEWPSCLRTLAA